MPSPAGWVVILVLGVTAVLAWSVTGARRRVLHGPKPAASVLDLRRWPGDEATLTLPSPTFGEGSGVVRLMIDPGHGATNNHGSTGSFCVAEQDTMLEVAVALADRLEASGHVSVRRGAVKPSTSWSPREDATRRAHPQGSSPGDDEGTAVLSE